MRAFVPRLLLLLAGCALVPAAVLTQEPRPQPATAQTPQQPPPQPQQPQTPPPPDQPIFRAKVNLVRVDVTVMDRDGEPLENLQPSDFQVKEDGVLQTVETVQFVRLSGSTPSDMRESIAIRSAAHANAEAAKEDVRLFVLFLDDYHVDKAPQVMIPLRRTLKAFVDKIGPYDLVAVMDPLTPLTHIAFTRDRNRILEIVQKFEGRRGAAVAAQHVGAARRCDARRTQRDRHAPWRTA